MTTLLYPIKVEESNLVFWLFRLLFLVPNYNRNTTILHFYE
nr:MAG TPA: hypothetical protein [Caudoviricetes sp.]DAS30914.1 MAG TPA: hypothetical protein [Caudoviricetes sp.]DAW11123.1 MAG TPA: hypothetical protein [Caudoviricetes sp.]